MFLLWFSQTRTKATCSPSLKSLFFFPSSIVLPLSLSEKPKSIFFVDQFLLVSSARIGKFQFQGFGKWFSISVLVLQFYFWLDLWIPRDFFFSSIWLILWLAILLSHLFDWLLELGVVDFIFFLILESLNSEDFEN